MRKLFILIIITTIVFSCVDDNGETAQKESFIRFYGDAFLDEGVYVEQLDDNGYLVAANFTNQDEIQGGKVFKLNEYGETLWEFNSIDTLDFAIESFFINTDNSIIFVGSGINPENYNYDAVIGKLNANGILQWKKYSGGAGNQFVNTLCQADDGGYVLGGSTDVNGNKDVYLHKFSASGDSIWVRSYGAATNDEVNDLCRSHSGGFLLTGSYGSAAAGQTGSNMAAIEINQFGNLVDMFTYEGTGDDVGNEVAMTEDGYIFIGTTQSASNGETDVLLVKTGMSIREINWQKTFGGAAAEAGNSVYVNANGTYTVAGSTESYGEGNRDFYVLNITSEGNATVEETFGSSADEWVNSAVQAADGGFILLGATEYAENRMVTFIKLNGNYEQQ